MDVWCDTTSHSNHGVGVVVGLVCVWCYHTPSGVMDSIDTISHSNHVMCWFGVGVVLRLVVVFCWYTTSHSIHVGVVLVWCWCGVGVVMWCGVIMDVLGSVCRLRLFMDSIDTISHQ